MHDRFPCPRGRIRLCVRGSGSKILLRQPWRHNDVLYDWATPAAKLFAGNVNYRVGGMYLEYENVADPEDPASIPSFDRGPDSGKAYFTGLSGDRDYIRVALTAVVTDSTDEDLWPDGNRNTYLAFTQGSEGAHEVPFGAAYNSKVVGGGLIVTPDFSDESQDIVIARAYLDEEDQLTMTGIGQPGLEWQQSFG